MPIGYVEHVRRQALKLSEMVEIENSIHYLKEPLETFPEVLEEEVAKYGMTCTDDYENNCNMRPEKQCMKFDSEDKDGFKYYYNWVTRDISKDICHVIEKSLTASYVILNEGKLPSHHYLPCFIKKDDFEEREDRAEKWIEDKLKEYGIK